MSEISNLFNIVLIYALKFICLLFSKDNPYKQPNSDSELFWFFADKNAEDGTPSNNSPRSTSEATPSNNSPRSIPPDTNCFGTQTDKIIQHKRPKRRRIDTEMPQVPFQAIQTDSDSDPEITGHNNGQETVVIHQADEVEEENTDKNLVVEEENTDKNLVVEEENTDKNAEIPPRCYPSFTIREALVNKCIFQGELTSSNDTSTSSQ